MNCRLVPILCSFVAVVALAGCPSPQSTPATDSGAKPATADEGVFPLACTKEAQQQFWEGLVLMWNGHGSEAGPAFTRASTTDPNCVAARLYAATANPGPDSQKRADEAAAAAARLPEIDNTFLSIAIAARKGDSGASRAATRKLMELAPKSWVPPTLLAGAEIAVGHREEGLAAAKKATELGPAVGATWNQLAYANLSLRKYDDAVAALKKYTEVAPTEPNAHDTFGDALLDQAKLEEAEAEYQKALAVSKESFFISFNGVAGVRFMKGDWEGGRAQLAKQRAAEPNPVTRLDSDTATVWSFVAQGKPAEALATLDALDKEAAKVNATASIAFAPVNRGGILVELEKYDDALKVLAAADKADLSKLPASAQRAFRLQRALAMTVAYARHNSVADAEKSLTAVEAEAKTDPGDPNLQDAARVARAEVLLARKNAKGAADALKDCLRENTYCQWRRVVALEAAGDKASADATRDAVMNEARRDLAYIYARTRLQPKAK